MILHQISSDLWTVLACGKGDDEIPLLDFLQDESKSKKDKLKILTLLKTFVPTRGVPNSPHKVSPLRGKIFEFKAGPIKGPKVRVLFFYDNKKLIICTHGFIKKTKKTPPNEIEKAIQIKIEYFNDKKNDELTIKE